MQEGRHPKFNLSQPLRRRTQILPDGRVYDQVKVSGIREQSFVKDR
jgi:hypothetical protein